MKGGMQKTKDNFQPLSSVFLQSLLYFDEVYTVLYFVLETLIFFYKGYILYYPDQTLNMEIVIFILFAFCSMIRLQMGTAGNKTESSSHIGWFLVLVVLPSILAFCYFLFLQTYILMIEVILNSLGLAFLAFEFITGIVALRNFKAQEKEQY